MTLKEFREQKGLSQTELANYVGAKQTTISQYENGSRRPNLSMAKKLADALYYCAKSGESCFSDLFAKTTARYVFGSHSLSPFSLAFIENFCYNSFNSFMSSFTKYLSVNVRLKKVAN